MTEKKVFMVQALLLGVFLSVPVGVSAAQDGRGGLGMNGERMGPPTIEDCVQRTGKTTLECQAMMDNIKTRQEKGSLEQGRGEPRDGNVREGTAQGSRFGIEATHRFVDIKTRIEKVIAFLASKGVDTSVLQNDFSVLKEKMTTAERDYTVLETARVAWKADQNATNKTTLESARTTVRTSTSVVKTYYHNTLLPLLKTLLQSVA